MKKKSYSCQLCVGIFSLKSNLQQHVKAVHAENKPFACEPCDIVFKDKRQLKWHIATIHRGK